MFYALVEYSIMKFSTKSVGVVVMLDAIQALGLAVDINPVQMALIKHCLSIYLT